MAPHLAVVTGIDPQLTRSFLLSQPSVVDASVWFKRGKLLAEIAVVDERRTDPAELKQLCASALGRSQAPTEITLINVRPHAA